MQFRIWSYWLITEPHMEWWKWAKADGRHQLAPMIRVGRAQYASQRLRNR